MDLTRAEHWRVTAFYIASMARYQHFSSLVPSGGTLRLFVFRDVDACPNSFGWPLQQRRATFDVRSQE